MAINIDLALIIWNGYSSARDHLVKILIHQKPIFTILLRYGNGNHVVTHQIQTIFFKNKLNFLINLVQFNVRKKKENERKENILTRGDAVALPGIYYPRWPFLLPVHVLVFHQRTCNSPIAQTSQSFGRLTLPQFTTIATTTRTPIP